MSALHGLLQDLNPDGISTLFFLNDNCRLPILNNRLRGSFPFNRYMQGHNTFEMRGAIISVKVSQPCYPRRSD